MRPVHADIDALKGLHEALVRFRYAARDVAERGDDETERTRASLAAKASRWQAQLELDLAGLDTCRSAPGADCSAYARAVEQSRERLEHVRRWQQRVDAEAGEFGGPASVFRNLLESDVPRAERQLLASIAHLEAARRVQPGGSLGARPAGPRRCGAAEPARHRLGAGGPALAGRGGPPVRGRPLGPAGPAVPRLPRRPEPDDGRAGNRGARDRVLSR